MFGGSPWHTQRNADNGVPSHRKQPSTSSSDFGDFHSASGPGPLEVLDSPSTSPHKHRRTSSSPTASSHQRPSSARLDETDLLGSFDDIDDNHNSNNIMQAPMTAAPLSLHQGLDLFAADDAPPSAASVGNHSAHPPLRRLTSRSSIGGSPSRSLMWSSDSPGPSSPPRVTDAHILIHAPQNTMNDDAASEFRRIRRQSDQYTASGKLPPPRSRSTSRNESKDKERTESPSRSLADVFATTRLASKWKRSVLTNSVFGGEDGPTKTALPIDISHKSPFATQTQVAGTYVPPSGAPAFKPTGLGHDEEDEEFSNTRLLGRNELTAPVLLASQAKELRAMLPPRQRLADSWSLLFSLDQHGASLSTLYRQTEKYAESHRASGNLLVVKDSEGHVFGIFLNEAISKREGTYYGSGESFMFKFESGQSKPRVFRWTGRNQYIALCESGFISFGGGGNSYGLILDATFTRNSSATSPAFDNDILCLDGSTQSDKRHNFECIGLEVWGTA